MLGADVAWMLVATALVLFMTLPGLALFYGGLVRARNVLSVLMQCFSIACLMSLLWLIAGYSIAFGGDGPIWGGLGKAMLWGVGVDDLSSAANTVPETLFFAFQMTFAIITPALIVGAFVERIGFGFVMLFSGLWMLICYAPVTHWVWGGGFLTGTFDFAGGIVVHETAGLAALILAAMLGLRKGFPKELKPPHNPGMVMIGASMLWIGWFGFNAGSALAANGAAAMALVVTHISAAAGALSWALYERVKYGKASLIGVVTGMVAGLATVTPASGYIGPLGGLILGTIAGVLCQILCGVIKGRLKIDDTLDVFAVHGVGGIFGTLMAPILALPLFGGLGVENVAAQMGQQVYALAVVGVFTAVITWGLIKICALVFPLRVDEEAEYTGLDISSHGERAYDWAS